MFAAAATLFLASCKKDQAINEAGSLKLNGGMAAVPNFTNPTGPWVVWGGKGDLYWSGAINGYGTLPSTLSFPASGSFGVNYAVGGRAAFNYLYKLSSSNVGARGIQRYTVSSSGTVAESGATLSLGGAPMFQTNEVNFSLYKPDTAYYSNGDAAVADKLKIFRFNPTATPMSTTGYTAIDFSAVFNPSATNVTNPISSTATHKLIGSKMIIDRGDYIFVDVLFGNSYNSLKQVVQATNNVYVAAYHKATGHITVSSFAGATNIGLFNDAPLVSRDEVTGDIYFSTVGNMATASPTSKILKINAGANTINGSWKVDMLGDFDVQGEFNTLTVYNNIIYTKVPNTNVTYLGSGHGVSYRSSIWQWTAIDASSASNASKLLNVPLDNYYAYQNARVINNEVYFIYNNSTPANNAGIKKITALSSSTFTAAAAPIATTAVSGFTSGSGYVRIMGLDRL